MPERHVVKELAPYGANQALDKRMRERTHHLRQVDRGEGLKLDRVEARLGGRLPHAAIEIRQICSVTNARRRARRRGFALGSGSPRRLVYTQ
jgi:hypothetical protein